MNHARFRRGIPKTSSVKISSTQPNQALLASGNRPLNFKRRRSGRPGDRRLAGLLPPHDSSYNSARRVEKLESPVLNLTIVYRPTNSIKPEPRNARTHSKKQIAEIAASIRQFG